MGRFRAAGLAAALGLLLQLPACAADLVLEGGRFRQPTPGFTIDDPRTAGPAWRLVEVEGSALAFYGPQGAAMSLIVTCGRDLETPPRFLAGQLLIGLEERVWVEGHDLAVDGAPGWLQMVDAAEAGRPVRLKTVTRAGHPCSYDWVLVAPDAFAEREAEFDRWWASFHADDGGAP